jgi:hypothetical protein
MRLRQTSIEHDQASGILRLAVAPGSTFASVITGLGYTQLLEFLFAGIFHGMGWTKWLFTNLYFSASFLLNSIGDRVTKLPASSWRPEPLYLLRQPIH